MARKDDLNALTLYDITYALKCGYGMKWFCDKYHCSEQDIVSQLKFIYKTSFKQDSVAERLRRNDLAYQKTGEYQKPPKKVDDTVKRYREAVNAPDKPENKLADDAKKILGIFDESSGSVLLESASDVPMIGVTQETELDMLDGDPIEETPEETVTDAEQEVPVETSEESVVEEAAEESVVEGTAEQAEKVVAKDSIEEAVEIIETNGALDALNEKASLLSDELAELLKAVDSKKRELSAIREEIERQEKVTIFVLDKEIKLEADRRFCREGLREYLDGVLKESDESNTLFDKLVHDPACMELRLVDIRNIVKLRQILLGGFPASFDVRFERRDAELVYLRLFCTP
ncbi:hypothetical protein J5491_01655 [Candidatus Saccharibacteria bacterium]|nr:hypothetical protein [Candidatus Saccharibacteria bacterium]